MAEIYTQFQSARPQKPYASTPYLPRLLIWGSTSFPQRPDPGDGGNRAYFPLWSKKNPTVTAVYSCLFCPPDLCSLQPWERSLFHIYTDKQQIMAYMQWISQGEWNWFRLNLKNAKSSRDFVLEVKIAIFHSQTTKNRVSKGKLRWRKKKTTLTGK